MIDNKSCRYLGIYPDEIERAGKIMETAMEQEGFEDDTDELWEGIDSSVHDLGITFANTITNSIIGIIFGKLYSYLSDKGYTDLDYYVNGWDSHFYINHEEVYC